jgi:hypothetical protein
MEVTLATENDKNLWDEIVTCSHQGTLFHTWDFLSIMQRHSVKNVWKKEFRATLYPLLISDKKRIVGIAPFFYYNISGYHIAGSPPFAVENYYLGPVFRNVGETGSVKCEGRELEFHNAIDKFLKKTLKPHMILIHTSPGLFDTRQFIWNGYEVEPRYTYILNTKQDYPSIHAAFSKNLRQNIDKVQKSGIVVVEGTREEVTLIHQRLRERNRIHAPLEYLNDVFDRFSPENIRIFIAEKNGEPVSGIITSIWKDKVSFWVGSPRYSLDGIDPNGAIIAKSIRWACEHGYSQYEIIGADTKSLFTFKQKFGADLILYYNIRWLSPLSRFSRNIIRLIQPHE